MQNLKFVASIIERDIDLLIMEELSVNGDFREWLSSQVFGEKTYSSNIGAWHSVCDAELGESDILFIFNAVDGVKIAILIENKIDAPAQYLQGKRYQLRGKKGIEEGHWEEFKTLIIAPNKYLSSSKNSESYSAEISYEEIVTYFQSRKAREYRFSYKAKIILEGIEQNRRGYQPKYNEKMTKYVSDYFDFSSEYYSHLNMQEAKRRPAGSTWISFHPKSLPSETVIEHQLTRGFVKVFFNGQAESYELLKKEYENKLPNDAIIEVTGKSVTISLKVPKLHPLEMSFKDEQSKVKQSLHSLSKLEKMVF